VNDQNRRRTRVEHLVADAAEKERAHLAAPPRAQHQEVVAALPELLEDPVGRAAVGKHLRHGDVLWDVVHGRLEQVPVVLLGVLRERLEINAAAVRPTGQEPRGRIGHARHDRQVRVAALGVLDRLGQRALPVRGAVDRDEQILERRTHRSDAHRRDVAGR
jgi:hypothetical protein